jgi:HEPN superfamily Swt1-like protein
MPDTSRHALEAALMSSVPASSLALYGRWWQFETWLRSLVYVELRAKYGVRWTDQLDTSTSNRQERDRQRQYMASPDWEDPLAYLDVSKLFSLVEADWDLFEPNLIEQDAWQGRRAELLKIRHRIGHMRRSHSDDLGRLEQTLRDLEKGAKRALLAYHREYDPRIFCSDDHAVVRGWVHREHETADRLIEHANENYGTSFRISLTRRPWASETIDGQVAEASPGYLWYVRFGFRERYVQVPQLWRSRHLDTLTRNHLIHVLVDGISSVTVTFPLIDGPVVADAIGDFFDAVLLETTPTYPGNLDNFGDDPLSRIPPLDPRVQVNSAWSTNFPEDVPLTVFSA